MTLEKVKSFRRYSEEEKHKLAFVCDYIFGKASKETMVAA